MRTRSHRNAVDILAISSCTLFPEHPCDLEEEDVRRRILEEDETCVLYILELESGNYYVGRTKKLAERIEKHLKGTASHWTSEHHVVSLCKVRKCHDNAEENSLVVALMNKVMGGIDRVRGGIYSQLHLDRDTRLDIKRQLRHNNDECFGCGQRGHFQKTCRQKRSNAKTSSVSPRTPTQEITASFASLHIDSGKKNLNRSFKRWNEREEEQMRRYVQLKWTDKQIAEKLERSERAIKQRKQLLGMG